MYNKLVVLILTLNLVNCQNWVLDKLISSNYNKYEAPSAQVILNASITLNSFAANEKSQSLTTDMTLCLNWTDYRIENLNSSYESIPQFKLTKFDKIWLPIVFFRNAMSSSIVNTLNNIQYLQVWPEQKLLKFCTRMTVEFLCRFNVVNFPFDEQYCNFELENFEKAAQPLQIFMQPMVSVKGNSRFRVRNTYIGRCSLIESEQYQFQELTITKSNKTYPHNCAFAGVRLVRNLSYYVLRYFCPSTLFALISFASMNLPTNAWPGRIMLTATVLLTVITTSQGAYNEVPSNDVVPLYWYLWGIQFFVYMTLIEFAFALAWVQFINDKKLSKESKKITSDGHYFGHKNWFSCCGGCIGAINHFVFGPSIDHYRDPINRNKVDYFSRILFPFLLLLFILVFIVSTIPTWGNKWRY